MNVPPKVVVELTRDELILLATHLHRHLVDVDKELVRTDNPSLQHAIAREAKALEHVAARLDALKSR